MKDIELDMHRSIDELGKFSVTLRIDGKCDMTPAEVCGLLNEITMKVTQACFDRGADMIGHVKACAHNADNEINICTANLTSFKRGVMTNDMMNGTPFVTGGYIMLHVIVHGLWDPEVRGISLPVIDRIMTSAGLEYRVIRDFFESEKRVKG